MKTFEFRWTLTGSTYVKATDIEDAYKGDRKEGDYGFEYEAVVRAATEQEVFEHEAHLDQMRIHAHEPRKF
jgi:hypothetical protein